MIPGNAGLAAKTEPIEEPKAPRVVRYGVRVTGHVAPFKWVVLRWMPDIPKSTGLGVAGEADTYEEALFEAAEAARASEWNRLHTSTVREEFLFETPEAV